MIASLRGTLLSLKPFEAVIECGGVGYLVNITLSVFEKWNNSATADVHLPIRTIYRENNVSLFGFAGDSEALLFDFLNSLQGIGPKNAMNLISHIGEQALLNALQNEDLSHITKTPGVGKAKAQKILFESGLKKKKLREILLSSRGESKTATGGMMDNVHEALNTLGFQNREIELAYNKMQAAEELPPRQNEHIQQWIRLFLKYL